ncbi:porin family protein [Azospirillum sp.]|uniref:outer membrane protein n=1 Tax=Azospirillum sp. TaxID=34012 RepID=UPI002D316E4D|nr:porin family protein [Azospirillum sp.]HYF90435.1 porin family protein [Azospirillum sp.]
MMQILPSRLILGGAAALALAAGCAGAAFAGDGAGIYVKLDVGNAWTRDAGGDFGRDLGQGALLGGAVGYRFSPELRVDLGVTRRFGLRYSENAVDPDDGTRGTAGARARSTALMLNGTYAPVAFGIVRPYVTAGVGVAWNRMDRLDIAVDGSPLGTLDGGSRANLALQAGAGVSVALHPDIAVDVGYRYAHLGRVRTGDSFRFAPSLVPELGGAAVSDPDLRMNGRLRAHELVVSAAYSF